MNLVAVDVKIDDNCYILYWRDLNNVTHTLNSLGIPTHTLLIFSQFLFQKPDFLDIACIRDVRTGRYANVPKDKNSRDLLAAGKSNASIPNKTISIYYGSDYFNIQCVNFVSMADNAVEVASVN